MKNFLLFSAIAATLFNGTHAFAQKKAAPAPAKAAAVKSGEGHDVKFHIKGLKDSTCYIGYFYGKGQYVKQDTAKADKDGNLEFRGAKPLDRGVYILSMPKGYLEFLIGDQKFKMETDTADIIGRMKVTGSPENITFYGYQKLTARKGKSRDSLSNIQKTLTKGTPQEAVIKDKITAIDKEVETERDKLINEHGETLTAKLLRAAKDIEVPDAPKKADGTIDSNFQYIYYKSHYFDNMDLSEEGIVRSPFFHGKLERYFKQLVVQYPDSVIKDADDVINKMKSKEAFKYTVWYIFNTYENNNLMGMDAVTIHMADNYYLNGRAYWIDSTTKGSIKSRADIMRPLLLKKKLPDTYLTDSNGKVVSLYSVKSKWTVVIFYDPDCGHCQKEIPILLKYWQKNKDKGIKVYAATTVRKSKPWKKFINEYKIGEWINVWDSLTVTDFTRRYDIYSTPVIYVLDENKVVQAKRISAEQLSDFFDQWQKDEDRKSGKVTKEIESSPSGSVPAEKSDKGHSKGKADKNSKTSAPAGKI